MPRKKLEEQHGQWSQSLERSFSNDEQGHHVSSRRRRHQTDNVVKRAKPARILVHFGELSAARVAMIGDIEGVTNLDRRAHANS